MSPKDEMAFRLTSPSFSDGQVVPPRYTCEGENISPALEWHGAPADAASFVLLCDDPDAPGGTWHHWALYDIPANTKRLEQGVPAHGETEAPRQGINDFGHIGYGGPCPPRGHGPHRYRFRLLALDVESLSLGPKPTCAQVEQAAAGHALAEALLVGSFSR